MQRYDLTSLEFLRESVSNLQDDLSVDWRKYPCLEWPRARTCYGYGKLQSETRGVLILAHRRAFEIVFGPAPARLEVCHHCDNPPCYRPIHLFLGTHLDNLRDCKAKDRNPRGERHGIARFTDDDVLDIVALVKGGVSQAKIAKQKGVTKTTIWSLIHGRTWRHLIPAELRVPVRPRARLNEETVREIILLWRSGMTQKEIAERMGVRTITVANALHGKSWKTSASDLQRPEYHLRREFSDQEIAKINELVTAHVPAPKIAELVGRNRHTINRVIRRLQGAI